MNRKEQGAEQNRGIVGWMIIGVWLLIFGLLTLFFQNYLENERNPNQNVASLVSSTDVREVTLKRNRFGHYNVTGKINGYRVEFLLDTGATHIAIPSDIANKIGLQRLRETRIHTANGVAKAYSTRLDQARVGDIVLTDLRATITTGMDGDIVLLGMEFLKRIEFTQRGDILILRQYPSK